MGVQSHENIPIAMARCATLGLSVMGTEASFSLVWYKASSSAATDVSTPTGTLTATNQSQNLGGITLEIAVNATDFAANDQLVITNRAGRTYYVAGVVNFYTPATFTTAEVISTWSDASEYALATIQAGTAKQTGYVYYGLEVSSAEAMEIAAINTASDGSIMTPDLTTSLAHTA